MINKFKMVPVELTQEMRTAYADASIAPIGLISKSGYEAMLAAVPASPQAAQPAPIIRINVIGDEFNAVALPAFFNQETSLRDGEHDLYTHADAGEVERLREQVASLACAFCSDSGNLMAENERLRAQLAEARSEAYRLGFLDAFDGPISYLDGPAYIRDRDATLSTTAKPEADHE